MNLIILLFCTISFQFGMTHGDSLMAGIPKEQMPYKTFIPKGIFSDSLNFVDPLYNELITKNNNSILPPRRTYFNPNRMAKYALAREDGGYVLVTGGLRWRQNSLKPDQNYVNSSGQFSLLLGYRFKRFSIESGYSKFSANNNYQFAYKGYDPFLVSFHNYVMPAIPLTVKYDMDVTGREAIRFGVLFSGNYALRDRSKTEYESKGTGSLTTPDGTVYEYDHQTTNDRTLKHKRLFLNAGVYMEIGVFNSSFLTLNITRNFNSPIFDTLFADYTIDGQRFEQVSHSGLNGYRIEAGYKLPLNILDKRKKAIYKAERGL